jgi:uncharacterized membrane protein
MRRNRMKDVSFAYVLILPISFLAISSTVLMNSIASSNNSVSDLKGVKSQQIGFFRKISP